MSAPEKPAAGTRPKPKYKKPTVVSLGELARAIGRCHVGNGDGTCATGNAPQGSNCYAGNSRV